MCECVSAGGGGKGASIQEAYCDVYEHEKKYEETQGHTHIIPASNKVCEFPSQFI